MNSYSGWHNLNYILDEVKVHIWPKIFGCTSELTDSALGSYQKLTKSFCRCIIKHSWFVYFNKYCLLGCSTIGYNEKLRIYCRRCIVTHTSTLPTSFITHTDFDSFTRSLGENFASTVLPVFIGLSSFGCAAAINFSGGRYRKMKVIIHICINQLTVPL